MIYLNVILTVKNPQDVDRVRALLTEAAVRSRPEPGCARFEVYHSQADTSSFLLVEQWESQAHLEAHRSGAAFTEHYVPNVLPLVERVPHPSDLVSAGIVAV
jgi:quinol monooxygenase YgiN